MPAALFELGGRLIPAFQTSTMPCPGHGTSNIGGTVLSFSLRSMWGQAWLRSTIRFSQLCALLFATQFDRHYSHGISLVHLRNSALRIRVSQGGVYIDCGSSHYKAYSGKKGKKDGRTRRWRSFLKNTSKMFCRSGYRIKCRRRPGERIW